MTKAVLIAIHPEWCEKIASGEKTIEVRKTRPGLQTPFKCYIYCTRRSPYLNRHNGKLYLEAKDILGGRGAGLYQRLSGCVIGEFVCNKIFDIYEFSGSRFWLNEALLKDACLSYDEIKKYAGAAEEIYGWHISALKIYDTPKGLSNVLKPCPYGDVSCFLCGKAGYKRDMYLYCCNTVNRPPQSWCYVEKLQK